MIGPDGNPVVLRGMVLDGLESDSTAPDVNLEAIEQARQWGANLIRLPLGEQFWISSNCYYDPRYAARVDQLVKWITSLGMVALLDLHLNTVGGCEPGEQHNMPDAAQAPEFWREVAARYSSNPYVAFDLYNEPHNVSDAVWLDGGTVTDSYGSPPQTYQAAGMQQLYDAVRSTGAQNLVFISGNSWANTVPQTLVSGYDIVYAAHVYTCPGQPPPSCKTPDPYDPSRILDNWVPIAASEPVSVTEFGWPSPSSGTFNGNVISFAAAHNWGWTAWAWYDGSGNGTWALANWQGTVAEPTSAGLPILDALGGSP